MGKPLKITPLINRERTIRLTLSLEVSPLAQLEAGESKAVGSLNAATGPPVRDGVLTRG